MNTRTVAWVIGGLLVTASALRVMGVATTTARAQEPVVVQEKPWIEKMFTEPITKDFGTVAHGAQLLHRFPIKNIYKVPLDIVETRPSCGLCVQAKPTKTTIQPDETAYIEIHMDGTRFVGYKKVTVRVAVAAPGFNSSTDLVVTATSRQDVVFNPGQVSFGLVNEGDTPTQEVDVEYAGTLAPTWKVTDVVANGAPVEIAFREFYRTTPDKPNRVGYKITVTLKKDVPAGSLKQELLLKTNDPANPQWSLFVDATVQQLLSISANPLVMGKVKVGEPATMNDVLRSTREFRILKIEGLGNGLECEAVVPTAAPATVARLPFKWKPTEAGELKREIKITTDLKPTPIILKIEGSAQ